MNTNLIIKDVSDYYTNKFEKYGAMHRGVDWSSEESQNVRFEQLEKIIKSNNFFSILDYGCGFGSLYKFLTNKYVDFEYVGFDISEKMIQAAQKKYSSQKVSWTTSLKSIQSVDYTISSGIFNVKLDFSDEVWKKYILDTLNEFNKLSNCGFSFNALTAYSDKEYMQEYLFYSDPSFFFDYCKRNFSRYVSIIHDYPLHEFTILVRK